MPKKTSNDETLIMSFHKYILSFNIQFILALEFLRWSMFEKPYGSLETGFFPYKIQITIFVTTLTYNYSKL